MFKTGDKVRLKGDFLKGEVVEVSQDQRGLLVHVAFSTRIYEYHDDELELVDEEADRLQAEAVQAKIDEATSAFEQAFKAFNEARNLSLHGLRYNPAINLSDLESAVNAGGWSTSSLYC